MAQRAAPGHDRDFVHRVRVGEGIPDQGVTGLVEGDEPLLLVGHDLGLALGAGDHPVDGLFELEHPDVLAAAPGRQKCGLVDQVGQIGAGEARGPPSQHHEVDLIVQRLALGMDLENGLPTFDVRCVDHDLTVESPGSEQGWVEDVGSVGRRHHDDTAVPFEAVELHQQLIQGLLALVVTATETGATMTTNCVDLIDEDDGRGALLGLVEQVAHTGRADARRTSPRSQIPRWT